MLIVILLIVFLGSNSAQANDIFLRGSQYSAATSPAYIIKVDDKVTDGCWLNPSAARTNVELALIKNGINSSEERDDIILPTVNIRAFGSYSGYECIIYMELYVTDIEIYKKGSINNYIYENIVVWQKENLMWGPRASMNGSINSQFSDFINAFILFHFKSEQYIFEKYPEVKENTLEMRRSLRIDRDGSNHHD